MLFSELPSLPKVKSRYGINFEEFAVLIFHPVTNEIDELKYSIQQVVNAIQKSNLNYIVIKPNNDLGTQIIQQGLSQLSNSDRFIHIPSMRFEYFLQLLKSAKFIIGNSSAGVREAAYYGVPAINIGTRQLNRNLNELILNVGYEEKSILDAISSSESLERIPRQDFGDGKSGIKFAEILNDDNFWPIKINKIFVDVANSS